ncbi:DUF7269 family protein [Haloparvum sp. AD34]
MRRAFAVLGVLTLAVGTAILLVPDRLPAAVTRAVNGVGLGPFVEQSVLGAAILAAGTALADRLMTPSKPTQPVRIDDRTGIDRSVEISGRSFDTLVDEYDVYRGAERLPEPDYEPGLDTVLVAAVSRNQHVSETEAVRRLRSGEWTENREAALLFGEELSPSVGRRIESWLRPETVLERRIDAAVEELDRLRDDLETGAAGRE